MSLRPYRDILKRSFPFDLYNYRKENLKETRLFLNYILEQF